MLLADGSHEQSGTRRERGDCTKRKPGARAGLLMVAIRQQRAGELSAAI